MLASTILILITLFPGEKEHLDSDHFPNDLCFTFTLERDNVL